MHQYYFDVYDGHTTIIDDHGDFFIEVHDAAAQASELLIDFAKEGVAQSGTKDFGVAIRDDSGRDVYRAALIFRDAYLDPSDPTALQGTTSTLSAANPIDLIRQSRETRAASMRMAERASSTTAGLSETFARVREAMTLTRAMLAAAG